VLRKGPPQGKPKGKLGRPEVARYRNKCPLVVDEFRAHADARAANCRGNNRSSENDRFSSALFAEKFPDGESDQGKMERAVSSFRTFRHIASGSALSGFPFIYIPARIVASDDPHLNVHSAMCRERKNLGV